MLLKRIIFGLVALTLGLSGAALAADKGMTITAVGGPVAGTSYIGMGAIGKEFTRAYPEAGVTLLPGSDMSNPFRLQNNEVELAAEVISMAMAAKARDGAVQKSRDQYRLSCQSADAGPTEHRGAGRFGDHLHRADP